MTSLAAHAEAAEPPAFALAIACPSFAEASRAALEARARAQLAAGSPRDDDRWTVTCGDASAVLTWQRSGERVGERTVPLTDDPAADVDRILEGLHALVAEREIAVPGSQPAAASEAPPAGGSPVRFGALSGGDGELWQGAIAFALGFHAGARVRLGGTWSVAALVGPAWGVGGAAGSHAWTLRGTALIEDEVVPHLRVGLGASGRILWASLDAGGGTSPIVGTTAGGVATVRFVIAAGSIRLSVGPQLEAMLRPIVVNVAGTEAFRIPTWIGSVGVEAETN